jgi:hypothetical protein
MTIVIPCLFPSVVRVVTPPAGRPHRHFGNVDYTFSLPLAYNAVHRTGSLEKNNTIVLFLRYS